MLEHLHPGPAQLRPKQFVPAFLASLVAASESAKDLRSQVRAVSAHLGFENFMYGATALPRPDHNGKCYVFTTMSAEWVRHYDQSAYLESDPRIFMTCKSAIPLIWDQTSVRGRGARVDTFLDDARRYGIASGVAFMFHGPQNSHIIVTLDSPIDVNDDLRTQAITRNLPDILMFGHYFHEVFMRGAVARHMAPSISDSLLSKREWQCLTLAANGMTTNDISLKLKVSARTVQFHFDTIRNKLGAANRQEAIALAVQSGVIQATTRPPG